MAKKRPEELSKSKFGAYEPLHPEGKLESFFYKYFIKRDARRTALNLAILTGLAVFYFTGTEHYPWNQYLFYGWIILIVLKTIVDLIYWRFKVKKIDQEMRKVEYELNEIKKEIKDRQKVFNEIKKEMLDQK